MGQEKIVSKKFRVLTDAANKIWTRISYYTCARDVEFNNGKNAQETLGSIYGISDSITSTSSNVAASAAAVKKLNDKISELLNRPILLKKDLKYLGNMCATYPKYGIAFEKETYDNKTGNSTMSNPSKGALCYYSSDGCGSKEDTSGNVTDFGKSYISTLEIPMVMATMSGDTVSRAWATEFYCTTAQFQGDNYKTNIAKPAGYSSSISFEDKFKRASIVSITLHAFNPNSKDSEDAAQAKLDDVLYGKKYTTSIGNMSLDSSTGALTYSKTMEMTLWLDIYKKPNSFDIISVISNNDYEEYKTIDSYDSANATVKFTDRCYDSSWNARYDSYRHVLTLEPYSSRYDNVTSYSSVKRLDTFSKNYDSAYDNLPDDYSYVGSSTNSRYEYYSKKDASSRYVDYNGRFIPYINYNVIYPVIEFYG